jgi:hypothetical protein
MKKQKKIGWQKYEDVIEDQVTNPFIEHILSKIAAPRGDLQEDLPEEIQEMLDFSEEDDTIEPQSSVPVTSELVQELSLAINYDCWVGHANFDITPSIKGKLKNTEGVEALRIITRYRFFIGVGKMFDFSEVRKVIESQHCSSVKEIFETELDKKKEATNEERNIE